MTNKIILGLIMGFLCGASSQALFVVQRDPGRGLGPEGATWFAINALVTPIITILWVITTFVEYPAVYGFMAIGEVFVGALIAAIFPHRFKLPVTALSAIGCVVAWVVL